MPFPARPPLLRTRWRAFTLIELMVVVVVISILAMLAVPSMIRAKNERRGVGAAGNINLILREARARAQGRGSAQALIINVGPGTGQRGTFKIREALDADGNPYPNCRSTNWNAGNIAGNETGLLDLNGGIDAQTDLETSALVEGAQVSNFVLCFAPNGRVYQAAALGNLGQAVELVQPIRFDVSQVNAGAKVGRTRSIFLTPNGQSRIQTRLGS
jgi:prepilin-type N-terminal cleavage/methylation domain-containing protein